MIAAHQIMAVAMAWILVAQVASSSLRNLESQPSYVGRYMTDAGSVVSNADTRHDIGIEKGEWLARLYTNCTVVYLDSKHIEDLVRKKAAKRVNTSEYEINILDERIAGATEADKERDMNGDSKYLGWIDQRENEEAEIEFYNQIISNAFIVQKRADDGLTSTHELEQKVHAEMSDLTKWDLPKEEQIAHAEGVYQDALMLWKQWEDSTKDYSCGHPAVVDHAMSQCKDGNTKFAIKCPVVCTPGYDDPSSVNSMRCRKMGKFGKELFGEWRGYASCIGRLCGEPSPLDKASRVISEIRFPNSAEYTCFEGYTQTGEATGDKKFLIPCGTTGNFEMNNSHACQRVKCGEAPVIQHTEKIDGTFYYSDQITYHCLDGYTLDETPGGLKTFTRICQATGQFTVAQICKPVRCGPPLEFDHTWLATGDYDHEKYFPDEVKYDCKPGYTTDQTRANENNNGYTLKCGTQGELRLKGAPGTLDLPRCQPVSAGVPDEVPHGALAERREMFFGQSVIVTAHIGYSTTGEYGGPTVFVLTVTSDGGYAGLKEFKPVSCGAPPKVNNGATTFTNSVAVYGDFLDYTCKQGFSVDATAEESALSFRLDCEADGSLSRVPGLQECVNIDDCLDITCGPFGACVDHLENYTCNCDAGYAMTWDNSSEELTCGNIDDCGPDACGAGKCVDGLNSYSCDCPEGYEVYDDVDDGETCVKKVCGTPPEVPHAFTVPAEVQGEKASYMDNIIYKCETGYSLDATTAGKKDFSVDCQASTQFTEHHPCLPIKCGKPPDVDNAAASANSAVYNETIKYSCATGYSSDATADGEKSFSITCGASGSYGPPSECLQINCGEPPDEPYSIRPAGPLLYDQSAKYECLSGYSLTGKKDGVMDFSVKCLEDGTLTASKLCLAKECGHPPEFIHALHATTKNEGVVRYPRMTEVTCRDGYTVGGQPGGETGFNVACLATGEFDDYNPKSCLPVKCGAPPDMANSTFKEVVTANGEKAGNQDELNFETKAIYECAEGFRAGGEPNGLKEIHVECLSSGDFSMPQPKMLCRNVNDCEKHTCGPKGKCIDLIGPSPAYTCECDYGYSMRTDDRGEKVCGNTDDCKGQDCGIGTCVDLIGDYTCICPSGYYIGEVFGKKTCVPVNCRTETPEVAHGKQLVQPPHTGPVNFPTSLHYKCDEGYSVDGSVAEAKLEFQAFCKPSGDLTGLLSCRKISCGTPHVLPFTELISPGSARESIEYEGKAKYKCFDGYTVGGAVDADVEFEVSCQSNGRLTDPGVCEPVKCGLAPSVPNGQPSISGDVYFGMSLVYRCHSGYTKDGTPSGDTTIARECKRDAHFSELPDEELCKPMSGGVAPTLENADLVSYSGNPVTSLPVQIFYPHGLQYECKPGYSKTGMLGGATRMSTRVDTRGMLSPPLPSGCSLITFNVNGQVKNARNGQGLEGVSVRIEGTGIRVSTHSGHFHVDGVPAGSVNLVYEKEGYIKTTRTLMMEDDISVGGAADISMSPKMASDQWRAVVKWGERPRDLDTYAKWARKKVCWYRTRQRGRGIRGTLEHDDTNSYGPETLHLTGVGSCRGRARKCQIRYLINDYGRTRIMKNTDVEVTLYTGESVAGSWKIKDCLNSVSSDGNWWHVFTVDGKTNKLAWNCKQGGPGDLNLHAERPLRRKGMSRALEANATAIADEPLHEKTRDSKASGNLRTSTHTDKSANRHPDPAHTIETKNKEDAQTKSLRAKPTTVTKSVVPSAEKNASPRLRSQVKPHLL